MKMRCIGCGNELKESTVDFSHSWKGHTVVFKDLPVLRCTECGQILMTPEAVNLMNDFIERRLSYDGWVPDVMTVQEAARYLRVSPQTIYQLQKRGRLAGIKIGREWRFSRRAIDSALQGSRQPGRIAYARGTASEEDMKRLAAIVKEHRGQG